MSQSTKTVTKAAILSTLVLAILMPAVFAVPVSNAQSVQSATTTNREITWLLALNIGCFNATFCIKAGGLFSVHVAATLYSDHTATAVAVSTNYNNMGAIVSRDIEHDKVTKWKIANGTAGPNTFILVSGTNSSTLYMNGHQHTVVTSIHNFDTNFAAKAGISGCVQYIGMNCPENVVFDGIVTRVS
jgi:hypothetical protein